MPNWNLFESVNKLNLEKLERHLEGHPVEKALSMDKLKVRNKPRAFPVSSCLNFRKSSDEKSLSRRTQAMIKKLCEKDKRILLGALFKELQQKVFRHSDYVYLTAIGIKNEHVRKEVRFVFPHRLSPSVETELTSNAPSLHAAIS